MLDIVRALRSLLDARAPLVALVGDRMSEDAIRQGTEAPYVIYQEISDVPAHTHQGGAGWAEERWDFTAWARTPLEARNARRQVRFALEDFSGTVSVGSPAETLKIEMIKNDGNLPPLFDDKTRLHGRGIQFLIHREKERD